TWSSSSPSVASIDGSTGVATAKAEGSTTVTAAIGAKSATATLTVAQSVATIEVSPSTATLESLNLTQAFTAVAKDSKGNVISGKTFTWSSDRTDVVSINSATG